MAFFPPPRPLCNAQGEIVAKFEGVTFSGGTLDDAGRHIPGAPQFDFDHWVRVFPYRTILGPGSPVIIGACWQVPAYSHIPPDFILKDMRLLASMGRGILLLATDREARDRARAFLIDTLRWPTPAPLSGGAPCLA